MSSIVLYTDIADNLSARKFAKRTGSEVQSLQKLDRKRAMDMSPYDTVYLYHSGIGYKKVLPMMASFLDNNRHQSDKIKFIIHIWHSDNDTKELYDKEIKDVRRHLDYFRGFCNEEPAVSIVYTDTEGEYAQLLKRDFGFETKQYDTVSEYDRITLIPDNNHMTQTDNVQYGRAFGYLILIPVAFGLLLRVNVWIFIAAVAMSFAAICIGVTGLELQRKIPPMTFYKKLQNLDGTPKDWPKAERYGRICVWTGIILVIAAFILMGADAMGAFGLTDFFGNPR